ncbi:hypothetical protein HK104_004272 [Borealophlyctis nickersoniae]|nr:hypothetical protein HK104_004272 [Borealophlyctis nickersoniae]
MTSVSDLTSRVVDSESSLDAARAEQRTKVLQILKTDPDALTELDLSLAYSYGEAILKSFHANDKNWSLHNAVYSCPEDPRWWVPKRPAYFGWTINMAANNEEGKKFREEQDALKKALDKVKKA